MTEAVQLVLGMVVGGILALAVLRRRRSTAVVRGLTVTSDFGYGRSASYTCVNSTVLARSRAHTSWVTHISSPPLLGGYDPEQVLYSPDAEEQLARLGVNREHIETVLIQLTRTTRRRQMHTVQLERHFGGHTLRLEVADPWPALRAVYVKQVEWCKPAGSARRRRSRRRVTDLWRAATGQTTWSQTSPSSTQSGQKRSRG